MITLLHNKSLMSRLWRDGAFGAHCQTEGAVDDLAARQCAENDMISRYIRATNYMELAVRRRSLAPVR